MLFIRRTVSTAYAFAASYLIFMCGRLINEFSPIQFGWPFMSFFGLIVWLSYFHELKIIKLAKRGRCVGLLEGTQDGVVCDMWIMTGGILFRPKHYDEEWIRWRRIKSCVIDGSHLVFAVRFGGEVPFDFSDGGADYVSGDEGADAGLGVLNGYVYVEEAVHEDPESDEEVSEDAFSEAFDFGRDSMLEDAVEELLPSEEEVRMRVEADNHMEGIVGEARSIALNERSMESEF